MGFWAALDEVLPETRQQRCWMHKTVNVLNCLPKSSQPKAKQALHNIWQAETRAKCDGVAFDLFIVTYDKNTPRQRFAYRKTEKRAGVVLHFPRAALAEHPHQQPD